MLDLASSGVHYFGFDFHRECKGKKLDNVARLVHSMTQNLEDMGFAHRIDQVIKVLVTAETNTRQDNDVHEHVKEQLGTVRTNCMDCLDRTNYFQV